MKTAILYSGTARTFASCFPNQYHYVLRHFPSPTIHVSVADDAQAKSMERLKERFTEVQIEYVKQPDFPEADALARKHAHSGYGCSAPGQNIMRAFWGYKKVWGMIPPDREYDIYVRIRPDLWFQEFEYPESRFVGGILPNLCLTPPWGSYGGVNDRFAVMGKTAASAYMNAFDRIERLLAAGCPFHPETLTRAALEESGAVQVSQTLVTEFKIRRMADAQHNNAEWLVPEPILGIELLRASLTK